MNISQTIIAANAHIAHIKNRKFLLGVGYLVGCIGLITLSVILHPEALFALSACLTGTGTGVIGIVWGIARENPVPPLPASNS